MSWKKCTPPRKIRSPSANKAKWETIFKKTGALADQAIAETAFAADPVDPWFWKARIYSRDQWWFLGVAVRSLGADTGDDDIRGGAKREDRDEMPFRPDSMGMFPFSKETLQKILGHILLRIGRG